MPDDKSAEQVFLEQYDHPDATPATAPEPVAQPRDPSSGQFVSRAHTRLQGLARQLGFSDEEIQQYKPQELREAIEDMRLARSFERREAAPSPAPAAPVSTPAEDVLDGEEDLHPKITEHLKAFKKQLKALQDENEQLKNHVRGQAAETFNQKVDRAFADLGDAYEPFLGKGAREDLDPDSTEMLLRQAVLKEAVKLAGDKASGEAIVRKVKDAATKRFGSLVSQKPARKPKPRDDDNSPEAFQRFTEEQWAAAGVARPSHREVGDELPRSPQRAELAAAEYLNGTGRLTGSKNETTDDQFLP